MKRDPLVSKIFTEWIQFFQEWQPVAEQLFSDWPFRKTKIYNPHDDWVMALEEVYLFLQIQERQQIRTRRKLAQVVSVETIQ